MIDRIFLTLFLDGGELPETFPPVFQENLDSVKRVHPGATVKIVSLNEARAFIAQHFEPDVREALDTLAPYAFKSDLVRYALMYVYGGLYTDVGIRWLRPLPVDKDTRLLVFKDGPQPCSWAIIAAVLYAQPGQPEFMDAIRRIVAHVNTREYGANPLDPSSSNLIGRSVAAVGRLGSTMFGSHRFLTPGEGFETPAFLVDGELIALKFKTKHGDISNLGFSGTNDYNQLWNARRLYGETRSQWRFRDRQISCEGATRRGEAVAFSPKVEGRQTYGPYLSLGPGAYEVTLTFAAPGFSGRLGVDVTADAGRATLIPYCAFGPRDVEGATLRLALNLDAPALGVEMRTYNEEALSGSLLEIAIGQADG